ncbi:cupredoxin domain-containing protein [Tateyamaria omphalii]|uniref:EfeO-type cupredoxin-like domain-containing protein n=1 Tax=Tateyamaria omphalii TaxID=299262 RepID=A0A1P8MRY8_9RHOB|nr:hypothetical protein [Tateyamaria omphalii]APX10815.1 hypothetical protein BWR18_03235 [Tateyamaria omphalii]
MQRMMQIGAVLATLTTATAVSAAEHEILILPDAYFPSILYIDDGDTVIFVNLTESDHNIVAKNGKWAVGPIGPNSTHSMVVEKGTQTTFYDADVVSEEDGTFLVEGKMSFGEAPLD